MGRGGRPGLYSGGFLGKTWIEAEVWKKVASNSGERLCVLLRDSSSDRHMLIHTQESAVQFPSVAETWMAVTSLAMTWNKSKVPFGVKCGAL